MTRTFLRRMALVLLAAFAFAQAGVALAACLEDRGSLAAAENRACECDRQADRGPGNLCLAHCTADLQNAGPSPALLRHPGSAPVLTVPLHEHATVLLATAQVVASSGGPPLRSRLQVLRH